MTNFYVISQEGDAQEDTTCREITLSFLRELRSLDGAGIGMYNDYGAPPDFKERIDKANRVMAKYGLSPITLDDNTFTFHSEYERWDEDEDEYINDETDLEMPVLRLHEPVYLPVVHAFLGCVRDNEDEDWFMLELISRVIKKVADYDDGNRVYHSVKYNGALSFLKVTDPKVWVPDFIALRKPNMGLGAFSNDLLAILIVGGLYDYEKIKAQIFRNVPVHRVQHSYTNNGETVASLSYVAYYATTTINSTLLRGFRNMVSYSTPWGTYNIPFVDEHITEFTRYFYHGEVQE